MSTAENKILCLQLRRLRAFMTTILIVVLFPLAVKAQSRPYTDEVVAKGFRIKQKRMGTVFGEGTGHRLLG
jgi:hypothetical protein